MIVTARILSASFLLGTALTSAAWAAPSYTFSVVPPSTYGKPAEVSGYGLNETGQVAGMRLVGGKTTATIVTGNTIVDLGRKIGTVTYDGSLATAIATVMVLNASYMSHTKSQVHSRLKELAKQIRINWTKEMESAARTPKPPRCPTAAQADQLCRHWVW